MIRLFWNPRIEQKYYTIELYYGRFSGKRIIKVDYKTVAESTNFLDTGSFHIFFIEKHRCIVAICPQTFKAEYNLFVDNRCIDTDETVPIPPDLSDLDTMRKRSGLETHRHEEENDSRLRLRAAVNVSNTGIPLFAYFFRRGFLVEAFTRINRFQRVWIGDVATELWAFCSATDSRFRRFVASSRAIAGVPFIGFSIIYHNGSGTSLKLTLKIRPKYKPTRWVDPTMCVTHLDALTDDQTFFNKLLIKLTTDFQAHLVDIETSG